MRDDLWSNSLSAVSREMMQPTPRSMVNIYLATALAIVVLLIASSLVKLDVMIFGVGKVVPAGEIKIVQHYEGGIVGKIQVHSGDVVNAGDVLLVLDNVNASSQLIEIRGELHSVMGQIYRLNAEISRQPLVFPASFSETAAGVATREQELFRRRADDFADSLRAFAEQMEKNQEEQDGLQRQLRLLTQNIRLMKEEVELNKSLVESGALSRVELLRMQRSLHEQTVAQQQASSAKLAKQNEYNRLLQASQEREAEFVGQALKQRNELETLRNSLEQKLAAVSDKNQRSEVLAPVSGTVNRVFVNTVGGVITPAMELLEIVPSHETLVVETKILPEDIAFITVDQPAKVRLTAYDYAVYGSLSGAVSYVGADSVEDEQGNQFFIIKVETEQSSFAGGDLPILSGMVANVDILAGKRTVFNYITKPVARAWHKALREN